MLFYERFEELLKNNNATIADVSRGTGIPYTTIDSIIKKKLKTINLDNAFKIAHYFEVSVDVLRCEDKDFKTAIKLTPEEQKLIELYRQLPEDERLMLYGEIKGIVRTYKQVTPTSEGEKSAG